MDLNTDITKLKFSKRALNALKNHEIRTIKELLELSKEKLVNMKNIGEKSVEEILKKIDRIQKEGFDYYDLKKYYVNKDGVKCEDLKIEEIGLSYEMISYLKNKGVSYYSEILDRDFELSNIEDKKIKKELGKIIKKPLEINTLFFNKNIEIKNLFLSERAKNCLESANIQYYSELVNKTEEELGTIKNLGNGVINEIKRLKFLMAHYNLYLENIENLKNDKQLSKESIDYLGKISNTLNCNKEYLISNISNEILENYNENMNLTEFEYLSQNIFKILYNNTYGKELLKKFIMSIIASEIYGINEETLLKKISEYLKTDRECFKKIIENLYDTDKITNLYDERYVVNRVSIKDEIFNIMKERDAKVILGRITGKTLEEIGIDLKGITRERVRQIESKGLGKLQDALFKEDMFRDLYMRTFLEKNGENQIKRVDNKELFYNIFNENETYMYLTLKYKMKKDVEKKEEFLDDILKDDNIPVEIRKKIEKYKYRNYIKIDKTMVKKDKKNIVNYVLKKYAKESITFEKFKEIYSKTIEALGYKNNLNFELENRSYKNNIVASEYVLYQKGENIRYYDSSLYDFDKLLNTLNLNQYKNIEYSALKFYKMYPELMVEYDIRNEYELHNLLKKICNKGKYPIIDFGKMPTIKFGKIDKEKQIKDFLIKLSPISKNEFIKEYCEFYGIKEEVFRSNDLNYIKQYLHDGEYNIALEEEYGQIQLPYTAYNILTEDLYTIEEVKEKFESIFFDDQNKFLNSLVLKKLGYKISKGYILKNEHKSASSYFRELLQKKDVIKLEDYKEIKKLPMFINQREKLKKEYKIIEFSPYEYINLQVLERNGITKDYLKNYCLKIKEYVGENKYFTVNSLGKEIVDDEKLEMFKFNNYFYASILAENEENFTCLRIGNNKLLYSGKNKASISDFLEMILYNQKNLYMGLDNLTELLNEKYGINIDKFKIVKYIESTSMYYNKVLKIVFADYEIYEEYEKKEMELNKINFK